VGRAKAEGPEGLNGKEIQLGAGSFARQEELQISMRRAGRSRANAQHTPKA